MPHTDDREPSQHAADEPGRLPDALRAASVALFGSRLDLAERYATLLATAGVVRGLIGPREASRIWDRHMLNCAAVAPLLPPASYVIDVGSGAGLPGIVLAIARPDLEVVLIEPLARRTAFLIEAVDALDLAGQVLVLRGRAEEATCSGSLMFHVKPADVVIARALAPLDRLAGWCLPLVSVGGQVLALKGSSVMTEIETHAAAIARLGGGTPIVHECGVGLLETPTTVVEIRREREIGGRPGGGNGEPRTPPGRHGGRIRGSKRS